MAVNLASRGDAVTGQLLVNRGFHNSNNNPG
jgi:hypothetical protein